MDPFVTLTAAAGATKALKLATGVCLVIQRDTIQTALQVASLDVISGGRFLFGIGGGWNEEEMADHGTVFKTRFKKMREQVAAMRAIWTEDEPEFHGEIVDFPKMKTWPKPAQRPYPPVIVGGAWPQSARRAIRYGDGWVPNASRATYADVTDFLPQFRDMAAAAGREFASLPITIFGAAEDGDRLLRYRDQGIARAVVMLPSAGSDAVLPILDRWAGLIRRLGR
jgi:probable F420-dependent oxidoreductase